jgi:orotidine-5'-phosphate decarboxylase
MTVAGDESPTRRGALSFAEKASRARSALGPLVVGLDPSRELLEGWDLGDTADGLEHFVDIALEATEGAAGFVKPQSAFYERHGWRGARALQRLVADARSAGLLVVVDAKRGDIGSTNAAYAEAYLAEGAPYAADALTVHPYLGIGAMGPLIEAAHRCGRCLFVVVHSSNIEGRLVQAAFSDESGSASGSAGSRQTVESALLSEIARLNHDLAPGGIGPIGAVVSPTRDVGRLDLAGAGAMFLSPGLGAQGATPADVADTFGACRDRVLPSASRSLLAAGPERARLRDAILKLNDELGATL